MFEQTFLGKPQNARKPYSIVLSLILQIVFIGILCLMPLVFTAVLPTMQLKSVMAAPPKAPVALKMKAMAAHIVSVTPRPFVLDHSPLVVKPVLPTTPTAPLPPPGVDGGDTVGGSNWIPLGVGPSIPEPIPPVTAVAKPKTQQQRPPIRVGTISSANLTHMVQPVYPPMARAVRVQGTVEFTATISKEGTIENLTLVHGHPLLITAAKEAVLQWRYKPTLLNGEPVEVITDIVVNFTLSQ